MIDILINKEFDLAFKLNIEGAKTIPKVRLIIENNAIELGFQGRVSEDKAIVKVPSLKEFIKVLGEGTHSARLEVFVDGGYFVPWEDSFNLKNPVAVSAAMEAVETSSEPPEEKINIKATSLVEITQDTEPEPSENESESKSEVLTNLSEEQPRKTSVKLDKPRKLDSSVFTPEKELIEEELKKEKEIPIKEAEARSTDYVIMSGNEIVDGPSKNKADLDTSSGKMYQVRDLDPKILKKHGIKIKKEDAKKKKIAKKDLSSFLDYEGRAGDFLGG